MGNMDDNIPITQSSTKMVDFTDNTEWTDKKHSLYLNSMEASFINQLYSSEYHSNDLVGCLPRAKVSTNKTFGQFKVPHRNCLDEVKFERTKTEDGINKDSRRLSENLWIQHFRPCSMSKGTPLSFSNEMHNAELDRQSIQLTSQIHGSEETCSKQALSSVSNKYYQESGDSMTEVSDQNFVDMELKRGEKSRRYSKKRSRPVASTTNDQVMQKVVPFIGQILNEGTKHDDRGGKKLKIMGEASQVGPVSQSQGPNHLGVGNW